MKKIIIIATVFFFAFVFAMQAHSVAAATINGDVNNDGKVDIVDYQLIQPLYGTTAAAGDFNKNGIVDSADINIVIATLYLKQIANTAPSPTKVVATPTTIPTMFPTVPPVTTNGIGPINLVYKQGGIWLTPEEIAQIPMDNTTGSSWKSMVDDARASMNIVADIGCTAGGGCTGEQTPLRMYARAVVGMRYKGLQDPILQAEGDKMIAELKTELDKVKPAVDATLTKPDDIAYDSKWAQRNLGPIAAAANIINYRPQALKDALRYTLYERKFDTKLQYTIRDSSLKWLTNRPSWGRWAVLSTAYLLEDWNTVNAIVKSEAKMLGETQWGGQPNDAFIEYTGGGASEEWHKLPAAGGKVLLVMPTGAAFTYNGQTHGIGGLYIADMWRSNPTVVWPPKVTSDSNYLWEGMAGNVVVSWAAHHLGYKDVFKWGDYALLRAALFNYSNYDGKTSLPTSDPLVNDQWQDAAFMTWAKSEIGPVLPDRLKPAPNANVPWPLPVTQNDNEGRGIGWMYATHYARLAK